MTPRALRHRRPLDLASIFQKAILPRARPMWRKAVGSTVRKAAGVFFLHFSRNSYCAQPSFGPSCDVEISQENPARGISIGERVPKKEPVFQFPGTCCDTRTQRGSVNRERRSGRLRTSSASRTWRLYAPCVYTLGAGVETARCSQCRGLIVPFCSPAAGSARAATGVSQLKTKSKSEELVSRGGLEPPTR